ncbi:hypothetical protein Btru_023586 [Bulinus truncatus]|nr:hypothetical protein Btru_023586 [Bulinus truncatus]
MPRSDVLTTTLVRQNEAVLARDLYAWRSLRHSAVRNSNQGPDWSSDEQDGGEGHSGTVVEISGQDGSTLPDNTLSSGTSDRGIATGRVRTMPMTCVFDNASCRYLLPGHLR